MINKQEDPKKGILVYLCPNSGNLKINIRLHLSRNQ
jgi:predicted RNA-binding Zn-ribbon protein involved in translation (DUF1610 family)